MFFAFATYFIVLVFGGVRQGPQVAARGLAAKTNTYKERSFSILFVLDAPNRSPAAQEGNNNLPGCILPAITQKHCCNQAPAVRRDAGCRCFMACRSLSLHTDRRIISLPTDFGTVLFRGLIHSCVVRNHVVNGGIFPVLPAWYVMSVITELFSCQCTSIAYNLLTENYTVSRIATIAIIKS